MRFLCDHDVSAWVATALRRLGHEAWTAHNAGLSTAEDDSLTVYAINHGAVLISHDKEFSGRRSRNVVGRHNVLRCRERDAADLLGQHLDFVLPILEHKPDVWIRLAVDAVPQLSFEWQ